MTDKKDEADRRETAALWYTELQDPEVEPEVWNTFLEWERDPSNAAAYREIETALGVIDRTSFCGPALRDHPEPGKDREPVFMALAAAAAAFIIGAVVLTTPTTKPESTETSYATAVGARETVTLEDGSEVTLNTNTLLTVSYSSTERLIRLAQGEALFEVEHSDRPFLVEAGGTVTRALGTEFDVHAEQDRVSVTLIRGSVRVTTSDPGPGAGQAGAMPEESGQEGIVLKPGERLKITSGTKPILSTIDPALAGKWREGLLQFDNVTLGDAIAEMNRYSTIKLVIDDETLAAERISGTFPAGKQSEFAESLTLYLPVQSSRVGGSIFISARLD
ncbi:FecR family protein [Hyphomonas sp. ND6WE1B]|uniref:FecR family protein n=1 Tax=Hyphomonas sp. ND6WE1B TaxID=1848191 RepID=UPI0008076F7F|nr:FecR domain-containing protein [Hyphomonas sp. ND6WE1B]